MERFNKNTTSFFSLFFTFFLHLLSNSIWPLLVIVPLVGERNVEGRISIFQHRTDAL